jgi:hypothetical protein
MEHRGVLSQAVSGLRLAAFVLLGIAWCCVAAAGIIVAFTPSPRPRALGWLLLAIATAAFFATMDRWVKGFPGLLVFGTLNGVLMIVDGHVLNRPGVPISRLTATVMTLMIAGSAAVSMTICRRKLRVLDRIALFVFVSSVFAQVAADQRFMLPVFGAGVTCLLAAWAYDYTQRRRTHHGNRQEA